MPVPEPLLSVARELAVLPRIDRRAILNALLPTDRERLRMAMGERASAAPVKPNASEAARHSAWLEDLAARTDAGAGPVLTPATRAALHAALARPQPAVTASPAAGRSLLQAATGLLGQAISR